MPSTRKQKAKERRSRPLDMMSNVENVDIMLGSYCRDDEENDISKNGVNLDSGSNRPQQSSNVIGEDFRSLLNTNSKENNEITIETTRMINEEISNQMSRKLNKIKNSLNIQIQDAISSAITEKILPSFQNTLESQDRVNHTVVVKGPLGYMIVQNQLISPQETEGPVGYNGTPKLKTLRNRGKIALESVLCRKTKD